MCASTFRTAPIPQQIPVRSTLFYECRRGSAALLQIALGSQRAASIQLGRRRHRNGTAQRKTPGWTRFEGPCRRLPQLEQKCSILSVS
jgi:hypothetical protein